MCRNNWETYTKQNVKHLKSSHGGCWSVSTLYCLRSSLQAPLLRIPTTDPLAAKELRAEAGNARNLNLGGSLTASPRDRSRSARPRGPAGPRGTWQLSEKEGERRSGGRVAEAPVPCWGSAGPLTAGRRSSAMRNGAGESASPAQGRTRTGAGGHRLPRRRSGCDPGCTAGDLRVVASFQDSNTAPLSPQWAAFRTTGSSHWSGRRRFRKLIG